MNVIRHTSRRTDIKAAVDKIFDSTDQTTYCLAEQMGEFSKTSMKAVPECATRARGKVLSSNQVVSVCVTLNCECTQNRYFL